jgi:hypothetical protein
MNSDSASQPSLARRKALREIEERHRGERSTIPSAPRRDVRSRATDGEHDDGHGGDSEMIGNISHGGPMVSA